MLHSAMNSRKTRAERIIGEFGESKPEVLFLVFAAMHGNETAGEKALDLVFKMLEVEPITNPTFEFKGKIIGLVGNTAAHAVRKRFIDLDFNRIWTEENLDRLEHFSVTEDTPVEYIEMLEMNQLIRQLIDDHEPKQLVVLDLHTTSAQGGIFSICPEDHFSIDLGYTFHAPVIKGFLEGVHGTLMHYFTSERMGLPTSIITFESGQHKDLLSINRAVSSIINALKHLGMVDPEHVENQHDKWLKDYAKGLPRLAELIHHHTIGDRDQFKMIPGFKNFDPVQSGQLLAHDISGPIHAPMDGLILMPLYQKQGADGFFIIRTLEA